MTTLARLRGASALRTAWNPIAPPGRRPAPPLPLGLGRLSGDPLATLTAALGEGPEDAVARVLGLPGPVAGPHRAPTATADPGRGDVAPGPGDGQAMASGLGLPGVLRDGRSPRGGAVTGATAEETLGSRRRHPAPMAPGASSWPGGAGSAGGPAQGILESAGGPATPGWASILGGSTALLGRETDAVGPVRGHRGAGGSNGPADAPVHPGLRSAAPRRDVPGPAAMADGPAPAFGHAPAAAHLDLPAAARPAVRRAGPADLPLHPGDAAGAGVADGRMAGAARAGTTGSAPRRPRPSDRSAAAARGAATPVRLRARTGNWAAPSASGATTAAPAATPGSGGGPGAARFPATAHGRSAPEQPLAPAFSPSGPSDTPAGTLPPRSNPGPGDAGTGHDPSRTTSSGSWGAGPAADAGPPVGLAGLARLWAPGDDAGGEQPATAPRSGHRGAGEDDPYRSFHSRLEQALLAEAMAEGIEVVP